MRPGNEENHEERLDALLRAYRGACGEPEAGATFMPQLWARIEARQTFSFSFGRVARGFVTAALAVTLMMALYLAMPRRATALTGTTYVDVLAASRSNDTADLSETLGYEAPPPADQI